MSRPDENAPADIVEFYQQSLIRHLIGVARDSAAIISAQVKELGHEQLRPAHENVLARMSLYGTRIVDIARALGVSKNAVGQLAAELEDMGYIERTPDPRDGRAKMLRYTSRGLELIADARRCNVSLEARYAQILGDEKLAELKTIMTQLARGMRASRAGSTPSAD